MDSSGRGRARALLALLLFLTACFSDAEPQDPAPPARDSRFPFADVTADVGVEVEPTRSWGATWTDYDLNGSPDLFVSRHGFAPYLFAQDGGAYEALDIRDIFYPERMDRHGCVWGEANGDGRPDLYCTQGVNAGTGMRPDHLYIQGDAGFEESAAAFGVENEFGRGRSANWLDYDRDGDLDLFVGNKHREGYGNVMFRNEGGHFEVADVGLGQEMWTMSSSWTDWDRDGDPDLLVVQYPPHPTRAFENVGGRFERVNLEGVTGRRFMSAAWGDFDADGWPDLVTNTKSRVGVFRNRRGRFEPVAQQDIEEGRMTAWLDLENDGDLDLYVLQGGPGDFQEGDAVNLPDLLMVNDGGFERYEEPTLAGRPDDNPDSVVTADHDRNGSMDVFINNGWLHWKGRPMLLENNAPVANWVALDLRGDPRNPWGLGARIVVRTEGATFRREVTDGFAFRGQSEVGHVHFGIGEAAGADVVVRWPDGVRDCLEIGVNDSIEVTKGEHPCS